MQKSTSIIVVFLCLILFATSISPFYYCAQIDDVINVDNSTYGYFSVDYSYNIGTKMKIGVTFNNKTEYHDYTSGEIFVASFEQGNGDYIISLYENIRGTLYRNITSKQVTVELDNVFSPYLVSTSEITFVTDDVVCLTANDICKDLTNTGDKVRAIYKFIRKNISYDYKLAYNISSGKIAVHHPEAANTLNSGKGICYDFAVLFAVMCRSQGIPCFIEKGYLGSVYHAWNRAYINGQWYGIDSTVPINNYFLNKQTLYGVLY